MKVIIGAHIDTNLLYTLINAKSTTVWRFYQNIVVETDFTPKWKIFLVMQNANFTKNGLYVILKTFASIIPDCVAWVQQDGFYLVSNLGQLT